MKKIFSKENIDITFEVSLFIRGVHAILEIISGILIFFVTKAFLIYTILSFTQEEIIEDPKDLIANLFITLTNNISINAKYFLAFYFLGHGIVKLFLVIGLLRKKLWVYPVSVVVFSLFIFFQLYRYFYTFSISLLLLTILDLVIIFLTVYEYHHIKNHKS